MPGSSAFELKTGVRRSHDSCGGELRDGNVIRMPIGAIRSERHDDLGLNSSNMLNNGGNNLARFGAIEVLVAVIEHRDFTHTQRRRGGAQLRFADARKGRLT